MVQRIEILHSTAFAYDRPAGGGMMKLRQRPRSGSGQIVSSWTTAATGGASELVLDDQFGNRVELVSISPGTAAIGVESSGVVETFDMGGVVQDRHGKVPIWLYRKQTAKTFAGPAVRTISDGTTRAGLNDEDRLRELSQRILERIPYTAGLTHAGTTAEDAATAGAGVCQDHAHIFIAICRMHGLPARYVSGYLLTADRTDHAAGHAWAEVYVESMDCWIGFDVSNGVMPDSNYVRAAVGRDYGDAAPITGIRKGAGVEQLNVTVQVKTAGTGERPGSTD